ncbi:MAG: fibronectin type III domain-containing protein, partial [Planctomycetaceae bacterium]|nr:fibronectin type III domain-containing protein [Planctomycetaceae bacterium]
MKNSIIKTLFDKLYEKKKSHADYKKTRRLSMESLEDRTLLSVTPADLQAIRAAYPDLHFSDSINVIEVTADQLTDSSTDAFNLRKALLAAEGTSQSDLIVVRTTDTANTIQINQSDIIINTGFNESGDVTIVSLGSQPLTIDANGKSRAFQVSTRVNVTFAGLVITGGKSDAYGGGIAAVRHRGNFNLINCQIVGNHSGGAGGGICYVDGDGQLNLINSTISDNNSGDYGGGVYMSGYMIGLNLVNSQITDNNANNVGGGIYSIGGLMPISITNSLIAGNTASEGGGIYYDFNPSFSITQTTIAGNTAKTGFGGGIFIGNSGSSAVLNLNNTIIAENIAVSNVDISSNSSVTINGTNNLIGVQGTSDPIEVKFVDSANGDYHLNNGSPAINAGKNDSAASISKDIEGKDRTIGRYVDIGAYEFLEKPATEVTTTLDIIDASDGLYSLREAIQYATEENNVVTFHASLNGKTILLNNQTDDYYQFYGELAIDKNVVIDGADKNITINADKKSRVFYVAEDADVVLKNLKLTGGQTTDSGGAILNEGTLTVINHLIFENAASSGGGIANVGTLAVTNCTIVDNTATNGGGIFNAAGTSTINNSIIAENFVSDIDKAIVSIVQGHNNISSFDVDDWLADGNDNYLYDSEKPLFAEESYEIAVASLAIDRGGDTLAFDEKGKLIGFDITGTTSRRRGNGVDIGAYESSYYLPLAPIIDITNQTDTAVSLAWNEQDAEWDESNKVWYNIAYIKKGETEWTYYQYYNGTDDATKYKDTSVKVEGLYPASAYTFRVEAENVHGMRASETEENAVITKPTANVNFDVEALTSSRADLIWKAQGEELTYEIYYVKSSENNPLDGKENDQDIWTKYTPNPNVEDTSFTVNGLESSTYYDFKLVVMNISGSAEAFIYEALTLPIAPTNLEYQDVTQTTITLKWDDQTGEDFYYLVEYRTNGGEWKPIDDHDDDVSRIGNNTSYVISGLVPSAEYDFRVIAENESGSAISNEITVTTKPAAPSYFQVENRTTDSVSLSWLEQKNLIGYAISYKKSTSGDDSWSEEMALDSDAITAEVNGLESSVQYDFRLTAINKSGNAIATVTAWSYPAIPTGLTVTGTTYQSVSIAWDANPNVSSYDVYYTADEDYLSENATWSYAAATSDALLDVSGLDTSTTYYFRLVAYNANDDASVPAYVTATTNVALPTVPLLEIDAVTYQSVAIVWAGQENLDRYELEYKTSDSNWNDAIVVTLDANAESYTVNDLTASTEYQFRLTATNESGETVSQIVTATTNIALPTSPLLEIDAVTYQSVALVWAGQENLDKYELEYKTSDSNWNDAISVTLDANAESYTVIDLTASTEYQFRLTATNESGEVTSQVVTATTNIALPTAPLLEIAVVTYQSVA